MLFLKNPRFLFHAILQKVSILVSCYSIRIFDSCLVLFYKTLNTFCKILKFFLLLWNCVKIYFCSVSLNLKNMLCIQNKIFGSIYDFDHQSWWMNKWKHLQKNYCNSFVADTNSLKFLPTLRQQSVWNVSRQVLRKKKKKNRKKSEIFNFLKSQIISDDTHN